MRQKVPALSLNVNTFLYWLKQTPPNLATFPKICLATGYDRSWTKQFDVSIANVLWQAYFPKFWFSCIYNQNFAVFFAIFRFLDHCCQFWRFFEILEKPINPTKAEQWFSSNPIGRPLTGSRKQKNMSTFCPKKWSRTLYWSLAREFLRQYNLTEKMVIYKVVAYGR